jgi:hypothetical protein
MFLSSNNAIDNVDTDDYIQIQQINPPSVTDNVCKMYLHAFFLLAMIVLISISTTRMIMYVSIVFLLGCFISPHNDHLRHFPLCS